MTVSSITASLRSAASIRTDRGSAHGARRLGLRQTQSGYALIEILVTLVILLFGLLGLAGVSARANLTEMESYQRVQAVLLLQDMADRLNANRQVVSCYSNGATGIQVGNSAATGYTGAPTVGSAQCPAAAAQAVADINAWNALLQGNAELKGASKVGAMIGAVGCITQIDAANKIYLISVSWQGLANTIAPTVAAGLPDACGKGLYSDERLHRVVSTLVQIGALT